MKWLVRLFSFSNAPVGDEAAEAEFDLKGASVFRGDQAERLGQELSPLEAELGTRDPKVQREAEKEVRSAAADSMRRVHKINRGYCPSCGGPLRQHLFASVCDACGWNAYDVPRTGPVKVHLTNGDVVDGDRCYTVKTDAVLILARDVVVARVPASSVSWIEYVWLDDEVKQREKQVLEQLEIQCGWCKKQADPDEDGFHLVHVAFGAAQERYVFCSDECYEAFRGMYPARVHRNCYERNCSECNLCTKRYGDETDGIHILAKDFLTADRRKKPTDTVKE